MFSVLRNSLKVGVVTTTYPATLAAPSPRARGCPEINFAQWKDARPAARVCPTGAISFSDAPGQRVARLDLASCVYCGLCAEVDPAIRMTARCEIAARRRQDLVAEGTYSLKADGTHEQLLATAAAPALLPDASASQAALADLGRQIQENAARLFGRSLHIREVDAGSCNGCEMEIGNLANPVYDLERFGIHIVASPRHADMLLVTGPVTRNMELALKKTYDATPAPRLVVAVGACGCSGGIFGVNYASRGGVDAVIPVDMYIPGCPPTPYALLHGLLKAIQRFPDKPR